MQYEKAILGLHKQSSLPTHRAMIWILPNRCPCPLPWSQHTSCWESGHSHRSAGSLPGQWHSLQLSAAGWSVILGQKDIIPWSLIFIHDKKYLKNAQSTEKGSCITIARCNQSSRYDVSRNPHLLPSWTPSLWCSTVPSSGRGAPAMAGRRTGWCRTWVLGLPAPPEPRRGPCWCC